MSTPAINTPQAIPASIQSNLHFLVVEVDSQLISLEKYFAEPSDKLARAVRDRGGYAFNLKNRIGNACMDTLITSPQRDSVALIFRSADAIAEELIRLVHLSRNCLDELAPIEQYHILNTESYKPLLGKVRLGLSLLGPALVENDSAKAIRIGELEAKIERGFNKLWNHYTDELKWHPNTEDYAHALYVANYVKQMGTALLRISEAIISASLGHSVNFERYYSLQSVVEDFVDDDQSMHLESIAQTRSGSSISGLSTHEPLTASDRRKPTNSDKETYVAVYKDGERRKLKEEHQGVKRWHEIYPGLAPKILSYKKSGESAALLIEHLPGLTFEQILLQGDNDLLARSLQELCKTIKSVWEETAICEPTSSQFMQQLEKRMPEAYRVHPEFRQSNSIICGTKVLSFDRLVEQAMAKEEGLESPFSVYTHGDFNVDNIIYDPQEQRVNFIDLHRSRHSDYLQDVSVFMVSNYRLQVLDQQLKSRALQVCKEFYQFASDHAQARNDKTFDLRLALGLARSFASSTRFMYDKNLATDMLLKSRYLIEQVLSMNSKEAVRYRAPIDELFVGAIA